MQLGFCRRIWLQPLLSRDRFFDLLGKRNVFVLLVVYGNKRGTVRFWVQDNFLVAKYNSKVEIFGCVLVSSILLCICIAGKHVEAEKMVVRETCVSNISDYGYHLQIIYTQVFRFWWMFWNTQIVQHLWNLCRQILHWCSPNWYSHFIEG